MTEERFQLELTLEEIGWMLDACEHYLDSRLKIIDRRARKEPGFSAAMREAVAGWRDLDAGIKRANWNKRPVEPAPHNPPRPPETRENG